MSIQGDLLTAIGGERGTAAADRLCEACVDLFEVEAAAISLVFEGSSSGTLGASGPAARIYDELQFTCGEGPCLDTVLRRQPVLVVNLADPAERRWPAYGPAMLGHNIRGVYAMPVLVAGEYVGALDLFRADAVPLSGHELAGAAIAAELAELPLLDLLGENLSAAAENPNSDMWAEINTLARAEVSQATGMLVAQLEIDPTEALVRLRAHAYATARSASEVARAILDRTLRLDY